jgi:hypothetical protein
MENEGSTVSTTQSADVGSVDTGSTAQATESTSYDNGSTNESNNTGSSDSDIRVVVDEKGNRRVEMSNDPFNIQQEQQSEQTPQDTNTKPSIAEPESTGPQYYADMNEVMSAAAQGILDDSRLSMEQRNTIAAIQQQEQQRIALAQAREQAERQSQENVRRAFGELKAQAQKQALQAMGISEEDLANADFVENGAAIKEKYNQLVDDMVLRGQTAYFRQETILANQAAANAGSIQEIQTFCNSERTKEAHYDEIIKMMDTVKMDMPYRDAQAVLEAERNCQSGAMTAKDVATFRKYYDYCKKLAYQKANNVSTTPRRTNAVPRVEQPGQPRNSGDRQGINVKAVRGMNTMQRQDYMTKLIESMM